MALTGLTRVQCRVSGIVNADLEAVWKIVREWQTMSKWFPSVDNRPLHISAVSGEATELGGLRRVQIGGSQMFEQLVTLDDEDNILRWKLISHPGTVNPFEQASFLNYLCTVRCHSVTEGNATFLEWTGQFFTEAHYAAALEERLCRWFKAGIQHLTEHMARTKQLGLAAPQQLQPIQPPDGFAGFPPQARFQGSMPPVQSRSTWPPARPETSAHRDTHAGSSTILQGSQSALPSGGLGIMRGGAGRPSGVQQYPLEPNPAVRQRVTAQSLGQTQQVSRQGVGPHQHGNGLGGGPRPVMVQPGAPRPLARTTAPASLQMRPAERAAPSARAAAPSFADAFGNLSLGLHSTGSARGGPVPRDAPEELMQRVRTDPGPGAAASRPAAGAAAVPERTQGFGSITLLSGAAQQALRSSLRSGMQPHISAGLAASGRPLLSTTASASPFEAAQDAPPMTMLSAAGDPLLAAPDTGSYGARPGGVAQQRDGSGKNGPNPFASFPSPFGAAQPAAAGAPPPIGTAAWDAPQGGTAWSGDKGMPEAILPPQNDLSLPAPAEAVNTLLGHLRSSQGRSGGSTAVAGGAEAVVVGSKRPCELIRAPSSQPSSATDTCTAYSMGASSGGAARVSFDDVRMSMDDTRMAAIDDLALPQLGARGPSAIAASPFAASVPPAAASISAGIGSSSGESAGHLVTGVQWHAPAPHDCFSPFSGIAADFASSDDGSEDETGS